MNLVLETRRQQSNGTGWRFKLWSESASERKTDCSNPERGSGDINLNGSL
jgi:hypothetical protein